MVGVADKSITKVRCYFYKKSRHILKIDCAKYNKWLEKKNLGNFVSIISQESNLASIPNSRWIDSGATVHISTTL